MAHERDFAAWHPLYAASTGVLMPPMWDGGAPTLYTLVFTSDEVDAGAMCAFYRMAAGLGISNPRLLTPGTLALASLYHPQLFINVARGPLAPILRGAEAVRATSAPVATTKNWLQSVLFLAGVTLSAAIVQDRWSSGTIRSKFLRLWQAGGVARRGGLGALDALRLEDTVVEMANAPISDQARLLRLKKTYAAALSALVAEQPYELSPMTPIDRHHPLWERFAFVPRLRDMLGANLLAIIAYGSSVTSERFADYDLVIVVRDAAVALARLASTRLMHQGVELNMSVQDEEEFVTYQRASGDNLANYGVCVHGGIMVPRKPVEDLMHRNLSFGYVRLRQIMGMAARAYGAPPEDVDEKANLYGYFVKIPLNVVKGTFGARGTILSKDRVAVRMVERFGYDVDELVRWCRSGRAGDALATAAWCTQASVHDLSATFDVFRKVPAARAAAWVEAGLGPRMEEGSDVANR